MEPRFSIVVAGHLCLDVIPDLSMIPEKKFMEAMQPGRLVVVGAATFSTRRGRLEYWIGFKPPGRACYT